MYSRKIELEKVRIDLIRKNSNYKNLGVDNCWGLIGLLIGENCVVDNGVGIATELGVGQKIRG